MSYNIITFKVKKLENLKIPVKSLFKYERKDWHPKRENNNDESVSFCLLDSKITGTINNDILFVSSINCSGEGSGTAMNLIFEPALKESAGELIASCVWESGDCINQLIVKDGNVIWKDIEI